MNRPSSTYRPTASNATHIGTFLRFAFSGKEKDLETGLSYFGARYYDADLTTGWLSVDPMSDKYPSMSPYNYCTGNPVKLVDPEGRDVWSVDEAGNITKVNSEGGKRTQSVVFANGTTKKFYGARYHKAMDDLSRTNSDGLSSSYGGANMQGVYANVFMSMADNTNVEWRLDRYADGKYQVGTIHQEALSPSTDDMTQAITGSKDVVTMIHSHPMNGFADPTSVANQIESMGYLSEIYEGDVFLKRHSTINNYYTYFPKSHQLWIVGTNRPAFIRQIKNYSDFFFGTYNTR